MSSSLSTDPGSKNDRQSSSSHSAKEELTLKRLVDNADRERRTWLASLLAPYLGGFSLLATLLPDQSQFNRAISITIFLLYSSACFIAWRLAKLKRPTAAGIFLTWGMLCEHFFLAVHFQDRLFVPLFTSVTLLVAAATLPLLGVILSGISSLLVITAIFFQVPKLVWRLDDSFLGIIPALILSALFCIMASLLVRSQRRSMAILGHRELRLIQAEKKTQQLERLRELVSEHSDDIITLFDIDDSLVYLSPSHKKLLSHADSHFDEEGWLAYLSQSEYQKFSECCHKARQGTPCEASLEITSSFGRAQLYQFQFRLLDEASNDSVQPADHLHLLLITARNIESQRRLIAQAIETQKLEAIGKLAGGVAHDFNNLLVVIRTGIELSLTRTELTPGTIEDLSDALKAAETASSLTKQLLAISRKQVLQNRAFELGNFIKEQLPLLRKLVPVTVSFNVTATSNSWVRVDRSQLQRVLFNLCNNASESMSNGGVIHLQSGQTDDSPYGFIKVIDSGVGIGPEHLARVFEPFFTTKANDHGGRSGSGLGLASSYGIIKQFNGHIEVESELGKGSRFTVLLPCLNPSELSMILSTQLENTSTNFDTPTIDSTKLLLVDDMPDLSRLLCKRLGEAGYVVASAANLDEARKKLVEFQPQLLIVDRVLGAEEGLDLLSELDNHELNPGVIISSGYSPDPERLKEWTQKGIRFIAKPFEFYELLLLLEEVKKERKIRLRSS